MARIWGNPRLVGDTTRLGGGTGGSLTITSGGTLTAGNQGAVYSPLALSATGGTPPYRWSVLPGGLFNPFDYQPSQPPVPVQSMVMDYNGNVEAIVPLQSATTATPYIQVTDSAGNWAIQQLSVTTTPQAYAFSQQYINPGTDNALASIIDPTDARYTISLNAWDSQVPHLQKGWSSKINYNGIPYGYNSGSPWGYPYVNRGQYTDQASVAAIVNGGSSTAAMVNSAPQLNTLTGTYKCKGLHIIEYPLDRTYSIWDALNDMYLVGCPYGNSTSSTVGAGSGFTALNNGVFQSSGFAGKVSSNAISLSIFMGFLDTQQYFANMVGTRNLTGATLAPGDYNCTTTNVFNVLYADGRMWYYHANHEDWGAQSGVSTHGGIMAAGTGGTNGTYSAATMTLVAGQGSGLTCNITVAGNVVTACTINAGGTHVTAGSVWSCGTAGVPTAFRFQVTNTDGADYGGGSAINNTLRLFPSPFNDTDQNGMFYMTINYAQLIQDLLNNTTITALFPSFHQYLYLANIAQGVESNGGGGYFAISAINTSTNTVTMSTVQATNPLAVGNDVSWNAPGGTTQLAPLFSKVLSVGGSSGAWTATVDTNMTGFTAFTSGGHVTLSVYKTLEFQTAVGTSEADPAIYTVPEISKNISRAMPCYTPNPTVSFDTSEGFGGTQGNANASVSVNASWNWMTNITGGVGASNGILAFDMSGTANTDKTNVFFNWTGWSANTGYYGETNLLAGDYTIQGNTAAFSGGTPPSSGWTTIFTVTGNMRTTRTHLLGNLYNGSYGNIQSLRVVVTNTVSGTTGNVAMHVSIVNATTNSGLAGDGHIFIGDSVTNKCLQQWALCEQGALSDSMTNMIYNYTGHFPITECAAVSGWALTGTGSDTDILPYLNGTATGTNATYNNRWINDFPGRYVHMLLGINDSTNSTTQSAYQDAMAWIANLCYSLNKIMVVPSIWWVQQAPGNSVTFSGYNTNLINLAITGVTTGASTTFTLSYVSVTNPVQVGQQVYFNTVGGITFTGGSIAGKVTAIGGSSGAWTVTVSQASSGTYTSGGYLTRPFVIVGPDLYTMGITFQAIMHNSTDNIHPSPYGQAIYRFIYSDWIARCIYLGQDPAAYKFPFNAVTPGLGGS